jgi:hypothetical protein
LILKYLDIKETNNLNTTDNELIMFGASMGGLLVRYALTKMEHTGQDHKTKLFISIDSPQKGANIPLGVQFLFDYLNTLAMGALNDKMEALTCDAAKEMLLYHYSATDFVNHKAYCATDRNTFVNDLASMGNRPQKPVTMGVSFGSGTAVNQGFSAGATLLRKDSSPVSLTYITLDFILALLGLPIPVGATLNALNLEFQASAVPNNTQASIFSHTLSADICIPTNDCKGFIIMKGTEYHTWSCGVNPAESGYRGAIR